MQNALYLSENKSSVANDFQEHYGLLKSGVGNASLSVVNQIYVSDRYQINEAFQEVASEKFRSGVESVDFLNKAKAAGIINGFVEEHTNGKIKELINAKDLSDKTSVVLINAVHFKGSWIRKFGSSHEKYKFYTGESESVDVDYMLAIARPFNYADLDDLEARALQVQYYDSDFSMIFILPNNRTGLSVLETKLTDYDLSSITGDMYSLDLDVSIPKFTVEFQMELNVALNNVCIILDLLNLN